MRDKSPSPADPKLVNSLTVRDARHILASEGELTVGDAVVRLLAALGVSALTARAITVGNATVWHLALPMVAQYVVILLVVPAIYMVLRHPAMEKDSVGAVRLLLVVFLIAGGASIVRSVRNETAWSDQVSADLARAWQWVVAAEMHWPIFAAAASMLLIIPRQVQNLYKHGPPFSAVDLGCGMRFAVLMLSAILIPFMVSNSQNMAWFLWAIILLAEVLTLWMHWDLQSRLRKVDAPGRKVSEDRELPP